MRARRVIALAAILGACAPHQGTSTIQKPAPKQDPAEAFQQYFASVNIVHVSRDFLQGGCGWAPPVAPYDTVYVADECAPLYEAGGISWQYVQEHEVAHTWAYKHGLFFPREGEVCTVLPVNCAGAERAAESVLQAAGISPPDPSTGWGDNGGGYGAQSSADIMAAQRTLWGLASTGTASDDVDEPGDVDDRT